MTRQRVLITTDVVGGVWDFSLLLAAELRRRHSMDSTLLVLGQPRARHRAAARKEQVDLLHVPLKLEWMYGAEADREVTPILVGEVARAMRADVVHANQFAAVCQPHDTPAVLTLHSDVLSWSRWTLGEPVDTRERRLYAEFARESMQRASAVVSVSRFLATEVQALYGPTGPIGIVHNSWPARGAGAPPADPPITFLAGRAWDAAKNIGLAAQAAQDWDHGDVLLAGDARHPESGARTQVPEPLRHLGMLSPTALSAWLRRASIYLSPARYDPFGLLPLQAALNGCALLLSDIPSYRELWDGAASFFRSDDAEDLREKWQVLRQHAELRRALRQRAAHRAVTLYNPRRMVDRYVELYVAVRQKAAA